jgi:hypothetical protein
VRLSPIIMRDFLLVYLLVLFDNSNNSPTFIVLGCYLYCYFYEISHEERVAKSFDIKDNKG